MARHPQDPWPQRLRFRELVDLWIEQHCPNTGKLEARTQLACELGISPDSLKQYYSGSKVPGRNLLLRMCPVFGCRIGELVDDPEGAPAGIPSDQWASASERTRVLASAMFQDLLALPEEEQQLYYELWKKGQEIGRQRLAAEAAQKAKRGPKK